MRRTSDFAGLSTFFVASALLLISSQASAQYVAEEVTIANAGTHLFQGTDADGGIGDWYLSNGVVEVIIDAVGTQTVPPGVTAPPLQSEIGVTGGNLLDLGLVGADNDQLSQLFTVGGLSTSNFITYDTIAGATTASSATITVTGNLLGFEPDVPAANLEVTTVYELADSNNYLTMITTVTNTHPTNAAGGLGGLLDVFAYVTRAIIPFSPGKSLVGSYPLGFSHPALDLASPTSALERPIWSAAPGNNGPEDGVVDPPSGAVAGEVAYGYLGVEREIVGGASPGVTPVDSLFGVSNNLISAVGNFPSGALDPGESLIYTRRIYVGDKNEVASVSNDMFAELGTRVGFANGTISGDIDAVDNPDIVASAVATRTSGPAIAQFPDGSPATHFVTDSTGGFGGIVLPEGTYDITFKSPERTDVTVTGVTVVASADTPVTISPMTGQGFAAITIFEKVKGVGKVPVPGRVTFVGIDGTPNPNFNDYIDATVSGVGTDLDENTFAGGLSQRNYAYVENGTGTVALRPGVYQAYGSHGPEYTLKLKKAKIAEGKTKKLKFALKRVVKTPDAISADFHIHSLRSFDTSPPLSDRVVTFAAEQVEVMVATDHDYHTDYSTIITSLGMDDRITSIVGNEVTGSVPNPPAWPDSIGHLNAWPVPVEPDARRDGSIEDEFVAPNQVISRLRDQGVQVIQYNHPRAGVSGITSIGYFNNFGYDPDVAITDAPNNVLLDDDVLGPGISGVANPDGYNNLSFDCMEIMNEVGIQSYLEMRRDWFSFLNQTDGVTVPFIAGTSVSDSHRLTLETAGYGRTYVLGVGDDPASLDTSALNTNVKAGKMIGTTGPYMTVSVTDTASASAGVGDTIVPATSDVTVNIEVQSAAWIPVEEVRIYKNGFLHASYDQTTTPAVGKTPKPTSGSKKVIRFAGSIPITLSEDSWIIVEAGQKLSPLPTPAEVAGTIVPGLESVAFSNPIWVDLAGDGFDPPGLPVEASPIPRAPRFAGVEELDMDLIPEYKHHAIEGHLPIHKITIPAEALDGLSDTAGKKADEENADDAKADDAKADSAKADTANDAESRDCEDAGKADQVDAADASDTADDAADSAPQAQADASPQDVPSGETTSSLGRTAEASRS